MKQKLINPFVAAAKIEIGGPFVGRKDDFEYIVSQMNGAQPTSINIVGDKRLGKSCLLYRFAQIWETLVPEPSKYVVIYLSCENVLETRENSFYQHIATELCANSHVNPESEHYQAMQMPEWSRENFNQAIKKWHDLGVLPVLCLDDFERLLENKGEFDNGFYNNLRHLMSSNQLMLIIASLKKLKVYKEKYELTSIFFNMGHVKYLEPFNPAEVDELLNTRDSSGKIALFESEQYLASCWGNQHPYLLQLACFYLFKAKQLEKDTDWAEKEYRRQAENVPTRKDKLLDWLVQKTQTLPIIGRYLSSVITWTGDMLTRIGAIFFIITLILCIIGYMNWDSLKDMLPALPKTD
ncbi:conserved hypothetical protein [Beggiatoa sp. PS]|nr:conserved hypothetical protein [Beggiatoa sp. PS]